VPRLTVFLKSTGDTERVATRLSAASAGGAGSLEAASGLTFRTWEELSPYYRQANSVYRMIFAVARLIVLVVALFSISGTLSLSILERLREIGTLRTFGSRRFHVAVMFLAEGLALGLVGVLAGAAIGWGGVAAINAAGGMTVPSQPGTSSALTILFRPELSTFVRNALWVFLAAAVGALVPASLSSRRVIAELLRSK